MSELLTKEAILAKRRKRVALPVMGFDVVIRALGYVDLSSNIGALLDIASLGEKGSKSTPEDLAKSKRGAEIFAGIERVVMLGVVDPKLGTDPAGPVVSDIPPADLMLLFTEICELSGLSKAAGADIRPS